MKEFLQNFNLHFICIICIWQSCCIFFVFIVMYENILYLQNYSSMYFKIVFLFYVLDSSFMCYLKCKKAKHGMVWDVLSGYILCKVVLYTKQTHKIGTIRTQNENFPDKIYFPFTRKESEALSITKSICQILASSKATEMKEESKSWYLVLSSIWQ